MFLEEVRGVNESFGHMWFNLAAAQGHKDAANSRKGLEGRVYNVLGRSTILIFSVKLV